jgi:hypothetical protein
VVSRRLNSTDPRGSTNGTCDPGVLIGAQRAQIRGTYGIKGSIFTDLIYGVCLPKCTQMHNDREVRAREGKMELRNSKEYQLSRSDDKHRSRTINKQPRRQLQMSYVPQGPNEAYVLSQVW